MHVNTYQSMPYVETPGANPGVNDKYYYKLYKYGIM